MSLLLFFRNHTYDVFTTTSGFAPRLLDDEYIRPYVPHRLELRGGETLFQWLDSLAKDRSVKMRTEHRTFDGVEVEIRIQGQPFGDAIGYTATAFIKGKPVLGTDGEPLELTASTDEGAFDRIVKAVNIQLKRKE